MDWENRLFTLSKTEYSMLPAILIDIKRIFNTWKREANVVGN